MRGSSRRTSISASLSVLLWALEPLVILLLAAVVLRERSGWLVLGLSAVAIGGLGLIAFEPTTTGDALGVGLTVAGVLCCAVYTIVARRWTDVRLVPAISWLFASICTIRTAPISSGAGP